MNKNMEKKNPFLIMNLFEKKNKIKKNLKKEKSDFT